LSYFLFFFLHRNPVEICGSDEGFLVLLLSLWILWIGVEVEGYWNCGWGAKVFILCLPPPFLPYVLPCCFCFDVEDTLMIVVVYSLRTRHRAQEPGISDIFLVKSLPYAYLALLILYSCSTVDDDVQLCCWPVRISLSD